MEQQGNRIATDRAEADAMRPTHHPVVDRIEAQPVYLQRSPAVSDRSFVRWLRDNLARSLPAAPSSRPDVIRCAWRAPPRSAAAQSWRDRHGLAPARGVPAGSCCSAVRCRRRAVAGRDVTHLHAHFAHRTTTVDLVGGACSSGCRSRSPATPRTSTSGSLNPHGLLARKMQRRQVRGDLHRRQSSTPRGDRIRSSGARDVPRAERRLRPTARGCAGPRSAPTGCASSASGGWSTRRVSTCWSSDRRC